MLSILPMAVSISGVEPDRDYDERDGSECSDKHEQAERHQENQISFQVAFDSGTMILNEMKEKYHM